MKKFCIVLCLILLVSILAACSESVGNRNEDEVLSVNNTPHNTTDNLSVTSNDSRNTINNPSDTNNASHNTADTPSGIATKNEHGYLSERLNMDLGNNIIIDATVSTPNIRNFSVRQAAHHTFNVAVARELLLGENNGRYTFSHHADSWGELIFFSHAVPENSVQSFLFMAELSESDLDFMSGAEAAQIVTDFFRNIGIAVRPTSIQSLDTAAIRAGVALAQAEFGSDLPDYTTFSESYIIEFTQVLDGVPVYSGLYGVELRAGTEMTPGVFGRRPMISAVVSEAGIVELSASSLFDIVSESNSGGQQTGLISLEQALETVRAAFANIINPETLYINDIELVYAILPESLQSLNSFEAWPAWVFRTTQQELVGGGGRGGQQESIIWERAVFVCAIDGIILRDRFR